MPTTTAQGCFFGPERTDLARHEFAGAAAQALDLIAAHTAGDPQVDPALIAAARGRAVSMLRRAASLQTLRVGGDLRVRVINQTGHKIPTGHIEGRRIWLNVRFFGATGVLIAEHGHYDGVEAELDEASTAVYEMKVGLSADAATATGLPAGPTGHMALADTIEKDNRIPPRGFANTSFETGGAPAVGATYADGQHWSDVLFPIPAGAVHGVVTLYYQSLPRHYIEELRDGNVTDNWGTILHDLWEQTGRGAPIAMASRSLRVDAAAVFADDFESGFADAWSTGLPQSALAATGPVGAAVALRVRDDQD